MAIEKMSLVNIVGSVDDMNRVMTVCCDCGYFHPESAAQYVTDFKGAALLQESNPYSPFIKRIVDLSYKLNFKLIYEDAASLKLKISQFCLLYTSAPLNPTIPWVLNLQMSIITSASRTGSIR